jgi:hypothetical protein
MSTGYLTLQNEAITPSRNARKYIQWQMELSQKKEGLILPGFIQVSCNPFQATDEIRR